MAIKYTITKFVEPIPISEESYNKLKLQLTSNPNLILHNNETFESKFGISTLITTISFIVFVVSYSLERLIWNRAVVLEGISIISFIVFLIFGVNIFLEGPSYYTYTKEKRLYFSRLKYAIYYSRDYNNFKNHFYLKTSSPNYPDFSSWFTKECLILKKSNKAMKRRGFYFLEDVSTELGIVVGIIFLVAIIAAISFIMDYFKNR